jgi:hypothetical protein
MTEIFPFVPVQTCTYNLNVVHVRTGINFWAILQDLRQQFWGAARPAESAVFEDSALSADTPLHAQIGLFTVWHPLLPWPPLPFRFGKGRSFDKERFCRRCLAAAAPAASAAAGNGVCSIDPAPALAVAMEMLRNTDLFSWFLVFSHQMKEHLLSYWLMTPSKNLIPSWPNP